MFPITDAPGRRSAHTIGQKRRERKVYERGRTNITVAISTRTIVVVATIVSVLWFGQRISHLLIVLCFAVVLATVIDQPVGWLQRRGLPRPIGVLAVFGAILIMLAGLVAALVPLLNGELLILRDKLPGYAERFENLSQRIAPGANVGTSLSFTALATRLSGNIDSLVSRLTTITVAVGQVTVLSFATIVIAYFLAVDPTIGSRLLARFVSEPTFERVSAVTCVTHQRIGRWIRGQLLVALTFGAAMGLGLWLFGIPYAVSLAIVAAVLEVVPYVGGAITVVLAVLAAAAIGLPQVIAVIVLYAVLVNLEVHVLSPVFLGHLVGLPSVAILIALLAGAELMGIAGILLAVPLTVAATSVIDEFWPSHRASIPPERPVEQHRLEPSSEAGMSNGGTHQA